MFFGLSRLVPPIIVAAALLTAGAPAGAIEIDFTAAISSGNSIDVQNVFHEGFGANLSGQTIFGSVVIDPASPGQVCGWDAACYADDGAVSVTVSFTLNGVTATTVSTGTSGYPGGAVSIHDLAHGGNNYLAAGATSEAGMVQESIGVLFSTKTGFLAYDGGNASAAVNSLGSIGDGHGLVVGGITLLTPIEHLDATIRTIEVPEPSAALLLAAGLIAIIWAHRRSA